MDKDILKGKLYLQKIRNCLKNLHGIQIVRILEEDENEKLSALEQTCFPYLYSNDKIPDSALSYGASEMQLIEWIKLQIGLQTNKNYYFRCSNTWVEIQISEIDTGIKSLWNHEKYLAHSQSYSCGFILVDEKIANLIEVGSDSRDEYHYLYDQYSLATMCKNLLTEQL